MHTTDKKTGMEHTYMHQIFYNGHDGTYEMVFSKEGGYFNLKISKTQAEQMIAAFKPSLTEDKTLGHKYYDFASEAQPNPFEEQEITERDATEFRFEKTFVNGSYSVFKFYSNKKIKQERHGCGLTLEKAELLISQLNKLHNINPPIVERDDAMDRLRDGVEGCCKVSTADNGDFDRIDDK